MRIRNYILPVVLMAVYGCSTSSDLSPVEWINDDASWVRLNAKLSKQWQIGPGKWERVGTRIFRNSNSVVGYAIKGDNQKFHLECQVFIVRNECGVAEFKALSAPSRIDLDAECLAAEPVNETLAPGLRQESVHSSAEMAIVVGASDMSVKEKRVQKSFLKGEKIPVGAETTNPLLMVVLDEMRGARQDSLVDCPHWRYKKLEFTGEVKATKDVTLYGKAEE